MHPIGWICSTKRIFLDRVVFNFFITLQKVFVLVCFGGSGRGPYFPGSWHIWLGFFSFRASACRRGACAVVWCMKFVSGRCVVCWDLHCFWNSFSLLVSFDIVQSFFSWGCLSFFLETWFSNGRTNILFGYRRERRESCCGGSASAWLWQRGCK